MYIKLNFLGTYVDKFCLSRYDYNIKNKEEKEMIKITKTIVDSNRRLIGFMMKGKEKEFGGFSKDVIERGVPTDSLLNQKFSNNQIAVVKHKIVEKNNFKINSLPMTIYTGEGYVDIDNSVNLIKRYVQNNKNIGFRVRFSDGSEDNFQYENVLMLCHWFRPGNFAIRTSSKGLQYICGKSGVALEDIPATIIGEEPEKKAKRLKSAAKEKTPEFNGAIESGFDILDIYEFIDNCHGCVIKLPSEDYEAKSKDGETVSDGFTSLGIGEVASARPVFNPTKLNVNAGFKKVGIVEVPVNGTKQNITTYVFRTKSIFYNGENNMKKFAIAVPTENEEQLVKALGASLALEKITDNTITAPLGQVIDAKSLAFYKVDASKVDLISADKRKNSILSAKKLVDLCKLQYELKLVEKAVGPKGGLMKELKSTLGDDGVAEAKNKTVAGAYSMYSKEGLQAVADAGIDIYSGAYTVPGKPYSSGKSTGDATAQVEIEYILKGMEAKKLTGSKIIDAVKRKDSTEVPQKVIDIVSEILAITDLKKQYAEASKVYESVQQKTATINKKLWMHNASMYIEGNRSKIHTHDAKHWTPDTSSRVKTANVYACTTKGCEGLTVKFKGVTI